MNGNNISHPYHALGWNSTGDEIVFKANELVKHMTCALNKAAGGAVPYTDGQYSGEDYLQHARLKGISFNKYKDLPGAEDSERFSTYLKNSAAMEDKQLITHLVSRFKHFDQPVYYSEEAGCFRFKANPIIVSIFQRYSQLYSAKSLLELVYENTIYTHHDLCQLLQLTGASLEEFRERDLEYAKTIVIMYNPYLKSMKLLNDATKNHYRTIVLVDGSRLKGDELISAIKNGAICVKGELSKIEQVDLFREKKDADWTIYSTKKANPFDFFLDKSETGEDIYIAVCRETHRIVPLIEPK